MRIGNMASTARNEPVMNGWIPIRLLPIPLRRLDKISNYTQEEQELDALQVTNEVISYILSSLSNDSSQRDI